MGSVMENVALTFSEEQSMLMDVARDFVRDQSPIESVRAQLETDNGYDHTVWREMVDMGWTGISLPETVGGAGMGVGSAVPVFEALGGGLLGTPLLSTTLAGQLISRSGGVSADAFLERLCAGEIGTVAFLDGSDWGANNLGVRIDYSGRLIGKKYFVPDSKVADLFVVVASRDDEPVVALVERASLSDEKISANVLIDLTKRSANIDFSGVAPVAVFQGDVVAAAIRDFQLLGALFIASETTGAAGRCLTSIIEYLKTRKQFGKLIGSYQALKHPTVDIYVGMENARSFIYHGASLAVEGTVTKDFEVACRMSKVSADEVMVFAGDRSVQFHGGFGFTWECDSTLFIRRAQWAQQMFGSAMHHRKRLASLLLDT